MDTSTTLAGQTVGVIGLGHMGKPMARNLHRAGARVLIHNRSQGVVSKLVSEGLEAPGSIGSLAKEVGAGGTIILMLPSTAIVEEVILGEGNLVDHLDSGSLVIDMSTTMVAATKTIGEKLSAVGCLYVDAPVSGGEVGAIEGSLTIMAGGTEEAYARARPLFEVMGKRITHVGTQGGGQVAKLANQVIVALTINAISEAFVLAEAAGIDAGKVRDAIRGGFAESRILELHGERMVNRDFAPGGKAVHQLKDVRHACELMEEHGIDLPTLKTSRKLWETMVDKGMGDLDHSGLFKLLEDQLGERAE